MTKLNKIRFFNDNGTDYTIITVTYDEYDEVQYWVHQSNGKYYVSSTSISGTTDDTDEQEISREDLGNLITDGEY